MRRLGTSMAALGTVFAMGSANALVLTLDDYSIPDDLVADTTLGGGGVQVNYVGIRSIIHELTAGANPGGADSNVAIGNTSFPQGALQISNAAGRDSQVKLIYGLSPGIVPTTGGASFFFTIVDSQAEQKSVEFFIDTGAGDMPVGGISFGALAAGTQLLFGLTAPQQDLLSSGGLITMVLNGVAGWDLTIDSFGLVVPTVPTAGSLALAGIGLVGAGLASRRRKAA